MFLNGVHRYRPVLVRQRPRRGCRARCNGRYVRTLSCLLYTRLRYDNVTHFYDRLLTKVKRFLSISSRGCREGGRDRSDCARYVVRANNGRIRVFVNGCHRVHCKYSKGDNFHYRYAVDIRDFKDRHSYRVSITGNERINVVVMTRYKRPPIACTCYNGQDGSNACVSRRVRWKRAEVARTKVLKVIMRLPCRHLGVSLRGAVSRDGSGRNHADGRRGRNFVSGQYEEQSNGRRMTCHRRSGTDGSNAFMVANSINGGAACRYGGMGEGVGY